MHVGLGPENAHLETAPSAVLGIAEKAAAGSELCQPWMGFPTQQQSTAELQCSTEKAEPPRERASTGNNQLRVTWLTYTQRAWHPSHFCPVWSIFAHTVVS